jgi:hypothetical protein
MKAEDVRVVHAIPGRIRLKVTQLRTNPGLAGAIQTKLSSVPGITLIEVNPVTGSVLVFYETSRPASPGALQALAEHLTPLFPDLNVGSLEFRLTQPANGASSDSTLAGGVSTFFGALNTRINSLTSGGADLKILLPLTLFLLEIRGALASEKLVFPTWYDLLWFSLGTFFMLNPKPGEARQ